MNLKSFLRVIVISSILATNLYSQAGDFQFTHITTEDGLSVNGVTQVLQDSKGFLWFGTYNGLHRYDGYNFKIFLPETSNPGNISSHSILSLYEDSYGDIWAGTADGLNKFDWKTETFSIYKNNLEDPHSLSNNYVYNVFEDKSGTLWVGTLGWLNRYNREKDNFTVIENTYSRQNTSEANSVTSIEEDYKGNLWVGTWNGLNYLRKDGTLIKQFLADENNPQTIGFRGIKSICEDNLNNLWIGTNGKGLEKYDPRTGIFTRYQTKPDDLNSISDDHINTIYQDKLNNIWIGTKNGLNRFDSHRNKFTRIFHNHLNSYSIINNEILSITEDKTGIIWIGTAGGISKFLQTNNTFRSYQKGNKPSDKNLSNERVDNVYIDKNSNIWISSKSGIDKILKDGEKIVHYHNDPKNKNSLSNNFVKTVFEDHSGIIWIGTDGDGLNRYNPSTDEFKTFKYDVNDANSLSNDGVTSIFEDHNNNLWIGTYWGLDRFDRKTETFYTYLADPKNPKRLISPLIWVIYEDSHRMIWLGTDGGGVSMFNPKTEIFKNFVVDSTNTNHISDNIVISILESHDGIMWFGTHEGLNSYDRTTGKFTVYNTKNGLLSPIINSIEEDDKNNLWIGTDKCLSKFDRKSEKFISYTKRNGLIGVEFSPRASAKSKDGKFFFGCSSGLVFFDPDSVIGASFVAPVVVTDFKIYNQSIPVAPDGILTESIVGAKSIRIPPGNDVITFEFAFLDYFNVKKNNFSYRLIGFDPKWNNVGNRNNATYTNLPPGEYTFLVKASNSDGVINMKEASVRVTIVPSFYQTLLFKFLFVFGVIFIVIVFVQLRTVTIKKQNEILEKGISDRTKDLDGTISELNLEIIERKKAEDIVHTALSEKEMMLKEKEVLLKEIHHRVKNNLQVISSLLYLNSKKIKDEDAVNMFKGSQNRVKSIALVHERLYQSKDLGKIDFRDYVQKLTSGLFTSFGVNQEVIKLENKIDNITVSIDTAVPCGLIINELISNSLKYAFPGYEEKNKKGLISICLHRNGNEESILTVKDNGVGMPEGYSEKKNLSLGLQLVDTLVAQLEGTLELDLNSGTAYKIKFKI